MQDDDNKAHPILFVSCALKPAESRYASTEIECLALVWALNKLSPYLDGSTFKLYTDHTALEWIWTVKETANQRLFRWSLLLNPLKDKVEIIHRPRRLHSNVDLLSRNPVNHYSVSLISISDEWKQRFVKAYKKDRYFKRLYKRLASPEVSEEQTAVERPAGDTEIMDDDAIDVDQTLGISKETFDWHIKKGVFTVVSDLLFHRPRDSITSSLHS